MIEPNTLEYAIHEAIWPHLDISADQNSWHIARAAVVAIPGDFHAERWKDIAYNENERAGHLSTKVVDLNAQLTEKAQRVAELESKLAKASFAGDATETLARVENHLRDLEASATGDEASAETSGPGNVLLADDLFSRFQAANRARIATKIVKDIREILDGGEPKSSVRFWRGEGRRWSVTYYWRQLNPGSGLEILRGSTWVPSEFTGIDDKMVRGLYSVEEITVADLPPSR